MKQRDQPSHVRITVTKFLRLSNDNPAKIFSTLTLPTVVVNGDSGGGDGNVIIII
jgi:hypothetical protein